MKKSSALLLVILLFTMTVLAACGGAQQSGGEPKPAAPAGGEAKPAGDGSLDRVKKDGLRVAIDATYPPMETIGADGKSFEGFDIDFAKALAAKLGAEAKFENVGWDGILTGLTAGRYDVIISSMNITPKRQEEANFVEYVKMSQVFVSRPGVEVKTEADLAGKIVAVQAGTTSHNLVEELKANKVKDIQEIRSFPNGTDALIELKNERAHVVVIDEPVGRYYAKKDGLKVTGQAATPEPVGIALRKTDGDLMKAIEKAVAEMNADGTIKKLSEQWFGGELGK